MNPYPDFSKHDAYRKRVAVRTIKPIDRNLSKAERSEILEKQKAKLNWNTIIPWAVAIGSVAWIVLNESRLLR